MTTAQLPISERDRHALEGNLRRFIIFRLFYSARFYYPVLTILFLDYGLTLEQFALLNLAWALSIVVAEVPSGALAYDSLKALGREEQWSHLLEKTSRVVSIGFFVTMILGAFVYDQALLNRTLALFNPNWQIARETAIRLPVLLTLLSAFVVLVTALGFRELPTEPVPQRAAGMGGLSALLDAFRQVGRAGQWILGHRFVLFVMLAALALDSVARQFVVLASEYYRLIDIPVSWFGFIGAGMSLFGIITARFSRYLVNSHTPAFNFAVLSSILLLSLLGLTLAIPVGGLLYTGLVATLRTREAGLPEAELQEQVFLDALLAFPLYYVVLMILIILLARKESGLWTR